MAGVCDGECMGRSQEDEPQALMRCHNSMKYVGGNLSVAEPT